MSQKYEIASVNSTCITVDVSLLARSDEMFFNATEMAKPFGKKPNDFLRLESTQEYIKEVLKENLSRSGISRYGDLVKTKTGGKYQGTWLHNELAFEFAGWCSALFRRNLHKWAEKRIHQEHLWIQKRLESKTGFLPLTNAVQDAHDPAKFYHYSNEADLINRIVLGMTAKQFKSKHGIECVRDSLDDEQLSMITWLQTINTGLIEIGMDFQDRKNHLMNCHDRRVLEAA